MTASIDGTPINALNWEESFAAPFPYLISFSKAFILFSSSPFSVTKADIFALRFVI